MKRKRSANFSQETCELKFALTDSSLEEGTFSGIASVFGSLIQAWMPTVIEPGAFTKTLKEQAKRIKLLWQHDANEPIGLPIELVETVNGLELKGRISMTQRGREALLLMRDKVIDEMSIGFDPIKWEMEDKGNGELLRHVKEVKLWEVSLVTFAADPLARIMAVHSVVPFQNLPLADEDRAWSAAAALKRVKEKCGLDGDTPDWGMFRKAHVWWDEDEPEKMGSYKLPIADIVDGKMTVVPRAIFAAAARLNQADVPDEDVDRIKIHLGRYYAAMDRTAPWDAEKDDLDLALETLAALVPSETHEGRVLSAKNKKLLQDAAAALQALLDAAEPPPPPEKKDEEEEQALTVAADTLTPERHERELALFEYEFNFS